MYQDHGRAQAGRHDPIRHVGLVRASARALSWQWLMGILALATGAAVAQPTEGQGRAVQTNALPQSAALVTSPQDTIELRRTTGDRIRVGYVTSLTATSDWVLVGDMNLSPHIGAIDRRSFTLVGRYGEDGTMPGQLREPGCITEGRGGESSIWVFDRKRRAFIELRINNDPRTAVFVGELTWPTLHDDILCAVWSDSQILLHSYKPDYLTFSDTLGTSQTTLQVIPPYTEHKDLNPSAFSVSPSGGHLALGYKYAARLDLFDDGGELYATVRGPRETNELQYTIVERAGIADSHALVAADSDVAYIDVAATDRFVYALFSGCPVGEQGCRYSGKHVQVFTWDGTFVRELVVDEPLLVIAVSADDSVLYGAYAAEDNGYDQKIGEWLLPRSASNRERLPL